MFTDEPTVYDPRVGGDFQIRNPLTGKTFSGRSLGFYVLESSSLEGWVKRIAPLQEMVSKTSRVGFFVLTPWAPGAKSLKAAIHRQFGEVSEFESSFCGYFAIGGGALERLLAIREDFGGSKSGEWGFGGCLEHFTPPIRLSLGRAQAWDFFHILDQPEKIGFFVYLGEMAQSTLVTKIYNGLDEALSQLRCPPKVAH